MRWYSLGLLLLGWLSSLEAARILAVLPLAARSHFAICESVLAALSAKGHDITLYSALVPNPNPRIKHFDLQTNVSQMIKASIPYEMFMRVVNTEQYFDWLGPQFFWYISRTLCEETLEHPVIQHLLASDEEFDLVITEAFTGQESLLVFGHKFQAPTVTIDTSGIWSVLNRKSGNELQTSHQPERTSLGFRHNMTFMERFRNTVSTVGALLMHQYMHLPRHQQILNKALGDKAPSIYDLVDNVSLCLVNWHPTLVPASATPNIVPIGGIHIKNTTDPLPQDIKKLMESGNEPVIYFSLGSIVPIHQMPQELIQVFVRVFAKLPYKVLWKTEAKEIPNLSANVKTSKWFPQQSILAHPNCILFITHGGLLSQLESFHAGVPVVGIPFFGDQRYNVKIYESLGVGKVLRFQDISDNTLTEAILGVVSQPKYAAAAKRVSQLYHHRPMSPADTAVFWVEHVLRYGGAHLAPQAKHLSYIQVQLLDVWAVMLAVVVSTVLVLRFILACTCCRSKRQPPAARTKAKMN